MAKIFRKEVAGNLVRACCFTMPLPRDTALERAEKQKMTSAARARMNVKTSWEKCRLTAAANFGAGDLFVSLTYDEASLPAHREEATSKMAGASSGSSGRRTSAQTRRSSNTCTSQSTSTAKAGGITTPLSAAAKARVSSSARYGHTGTSI